MDSSANLPAGRAALVIGHPGHELRVHHWLEVAAPDVFVLTDGSGAAAEGRIESTTDLLREAGGRPASIYGPLTDRQIYGSMMEHRIGLFIDLTEELVHQFEKNRVDYVVGDACEGYSPTHDLCRLIIGAAVEIVGRRRGAPLPNYDFFLTGLPDQKSGDTEEGVARLRLDEDAFVRKIAAALGYRELAAEVEAAEREVGLDAFRVERLRRVSSQTGYDGPPESPPFYETYGAQQVAAGRYDRLIRYRDHVAPLAAALWEHARAAHSVTVPA